jgi:hypothetical protein
MADPSLFDFLRIPTDALIALDDRTLHFAMQPYHFIIRLIHVLSMAAFFGGIALLDLRLMGWRATIPLRAFTENVLPWLYVTFGVTVVTGVLLFLFDPVHVGTHAYFAPKLLLIALGLGNAAVFHRTAYLRAMAAQGSLPWRAKLSGAVSLAFWTGVVICSSLNVESMPKVFLR